MVLKSLVILYTLQTPVTMILDNFQFKQDKVCCISDIHIGVHQNSQMWLDICSKWADWLVDELLKNDIKDIIICGDLFHYRDEIAVNTINHVTNFLQKLSNFNIIMLVGNHDAYYKDRSDVNSLSILAGWPNIAIVQHEYHLMSHGGTDLCFVPWGVSDDKIPENNITFGHFEIESFNMQTNFTCKHGIKSKNLLKKSDLIISGHFHTREERKYKTGNIIYLGNPYQMDFGDAKQTKGIYIVDLTTKNYNFIPNNISPTHEKISLSDLVEHGDIDGEIISRVRNNIVRFVVDRNIAPDEIEQLLRLLSSYKPITLTTDYNINFDRFGLDESDADLSGISIANAIEEFVNLLDVDNKKNVIQYTTELYNKCK